MSGFDRVQAMLDLGGPALWVIAALSVLTVALTLWKLWRLALAGVWSPGRAEAVVTGRAAPVPQARNLHLRFVSRVAGVLSGPMAPQAQRDEITRLALRELTPLRAGLRALELIVTIAPLVGLLGTVLGMIAAFQALQQAGGQTDPATLAGGIWEALLTTAAGMAVAIPAAIALSGFESVAERVQADLEDMATRMTGRAGGA